MFEWCQHPMQKYWKKYWKNRALQVDGSRNGIYGYLPNWSAVIHVLRISFLCHVSIVLNPYANWTFIILIMLNTVLVFLTKFWWVQEKNREPSDFHFGIDWAYERDEILKESQLRRHPLRRSLSIVQDDYGLTKNGIFGHQEWVSNAMPVLIPRAKPVEFFFFKSRRSSEASTFSRYR